MVATWSPDHDVIKWLRPARDKMAIISIASLTSWLDGGCDVYKCSHDIFVTIHTTFQKDSTAIARVRIFDFAPNCEQDNRRLDAKGQPLLVVHIDFFLSLFERYKINDKRRCKLSLHRRPDSTCG
jgi:hypothetical protein